MPKGIYLHKRKTLQERFESKLPRNCDLDSCWIWQGSCMDNGYGKLGIDRKTAPALAHRVSYELYTGPIPDNMQVCHTCDNPRCVNPSHLYIGSRSNNMNDMHRRKRSRWHKYKNGTLDGHAPQTEKGQWLLRSRNSKGQFT